MFQGGTSTGREMHGRCESVVNIDSPDPRDCREGRAVHDHVPRARLVHDSEGDVLVSASMRSLPGPELNASYNVPNSIFLAQLAGCRGRTTTGNQSVQLFDSFQLFAEER